MGRADLAEGDLLGPELAVVDPEHEEVRHLRSERCEVSRGARQPTQNVRPAAQSRAKERRSGGPSENPARKTKPRAQRQRYNGSISTQLMIHS